MPRSRATSRLSADSEVEILIEQDGIGRTMQFAEVLVEPGAPVGSLQRARISDHDGRRLIGRGGCVSGADVKKEKGLLGRLLGGKTGERRGRRSCCEGRA